MRGRVFVIVFIVVVLCFSFVSFGEEWLPPCVDLRDLESLQRFVAAEATQKYQILYERAPRYSEQQLSSHISIGEMMKESGYTIPLVAQAELSGINIMYHEEGVFYRYTLTEPVGQLDYVVICVEPLTAEKIARIESYGYLFYRRVRLQFKEEIYAQPLSVRGNVYDGAKVESVYIERVGELLFSASCPGVDEYAIYHNEQVIRFLFEADSSEEDRLQFLDRVSFEDVEGVPTPFPWGIIFIAAGIAFVCGAAVTVLLLRKRRKKALVTMEQGVTPSAPDESLAGQEETSVASGGSPAEQ